MAQGKFIAIEGCEGVGKTTQAKLLIDKLRASGRKAEYVREPGGEPMAEKIRELLIHTELHRTLEAELLLFNAARVQILHKVNGILAKGVDVISDRSYLSSLAYQGYGQGMDLDVVRSACEIATRGTKYDLIIVLDAPIEVGIKRLDIRGGKDRFEQMDASFHEKVRKGFLAEAKRLNLPVVDGSGSIDGISDKIWDLAKG